MSLFCQCILQHRKQVTHPKEIFVHGCFYFTQNISLQLAYRCAIWACFKWATLKHSLAVDHLELACALGTGGTPVWSRLVSSVARVIATDAGRRSNRKSKLGAS